MSIYTNVSRRATPQSEQADPRQIRNSAGGFTFGLDDTARLRRFLILGTEGGTYYASARDLTIQNVEVVERLARDNPQGAVDIIREVSVAGRAPKAQPALLALAIIASTADTEGRRAAFAAVPDVVRTGTHLFQFVTYLENFRGWGRAAKRAIAEWYTLKDADDLAYQLLKYRQREGWTHRDLLRLTHAKAPSPEHAGLFAYAVGKPGKMHPRVTAFEEVQHATVDEAVQLIQNHRLSWEMLPDRLLSERKVWEALLAGSLPLGALIRQLPRLTNLGLDGREVTSRLADEDALKKARIHPLNVLVALKAYKSSMSRGGVQWSPSRAVIDVLDEAFYLSFGAVEPTGKRTLLALDVSASMAVDNIAGMGITPREASTAMAMVTARVEDEWEAVAFSTTLSPLTISPRQRLDDVTQAIAMMHFGRTDCAAPMQWALKNRREIDTFVVYTDNETWFGNVHPHQALVQYRQKMGIDAKLVVVGMTATQFTIADPSDPGMLDVVGFDTAAPALIGDFARGL